MKEHSNSFNPHLLPKGMYRLSHKVGFLSAVQRIKRLSSNCREAGGVRFVTAWLALGAKIESASGCEGARGFLPTAYAILTSYFGDVYLLAPGADWSFQNSVIRAPTR